MNKNELWCSVGMASAIAVTISPALNILATVFNIPFFDKIIMAICLTIVFMILDYLKKQKLKYSKTLIILGFAIGIISGIITGDVYFT